MIVKAKWNVKDSHGWHFAGEVFETEDHLGNAVEEILPSEKKPEEQPEPAPAVSKPRTTRRKTAK